MSNRHECPHGWDWRYGGGCASCSDQAQADYEYAVGCEERHEAELTALRARLTAARAALVKYGQHGGNCPAGGKTMARLVEDDDGSRALYPCTCGLDAALAALAEGGT